MDNENIIGFDSKTSRDVKPIFLLAVFMPPAEATFEAVEHVVWLKVVGH